MGGYSKHFSCGNSHLPGRKVIVMAVKTKQRKKEKEKRKKHISCSQGFYKICLMLNSAEHEVFSAYKYENENNSIRNAKLKTMPQHAND